MRLRLLAVAVLFFIVASQAVAAPADRQQYIVKTKRLIAQPHAKAAPSVQDVVRAAGGHVDYEWRDRFVITLPDSAVQALVQHPGRRVCSKGHQRYLRGDTAAVSAEPVVTSATFRAAPKRFLPWTSGTYSYDGQGNITGIGSNAYSYDAFSRLATSTTNGIPETYSYDRYGNLTQKVTGTGSTALKVQSGVDDGNHLSGHCYDAAGNLTDDRDADPVHCPTATETYSFDALNRMTMKWDRVKHTKEYYIYNANDERIAVIPCSETACTEQIRFSFRDESGKVLRQFPYQQFDSPWTWVEDYVYRDGVLLAAERVPAQGGRRYFHTDHLGTPRLVTDSSARRISEHDYFPFGVEATPLRQDTLPVNGFNREEPMKFTGHERDFTGGTSAENSNYIDYMHARSTVPQWGRFLSVDPTWDSSDLASPQSWNRYSYVQNRPINFTDPDGRILDTVLDVAFVLYDLADIAATKIGGGRVTTTQELALGADVAATFIPFVTGAGIGVRAARAAAHAEDVVHVVEGAKDTGELLHHYGTAKKTVGTLAKKSAEAEGKIGEHGVSATTAVPTKPHTSASRAEVEKHFPVKQTGADPHNHTVVLPKPITQRVADLFNELFHRN